jgi:heterodisulfide reductase subunit A-like polyferredoxin
MSAETGTSETKSSKRGSVLVIGGGIGGMQAALDLGDSGFKVHMVQKESSIGGIMSALDKTFPTGDCAMCMISPKMVDLGRHLNIDIHSCSELIELAGEPGDFSATILKKARYVDLKKCTGCEACVAKCPVQASSEFNQDLAIRTAINRRYPQAVPGAVAIDKLGVSPCRIECPAEVNAHAYVTLIARGRYAEALQVVRRNNPFPAVTGRVCNHPCETGCRRKDLDDPVSICSLKRFLTDWEDKNDGFVKPVLPEEKLEKIAIVGSGPAGLTCARDLSLKGYQVTVFEKMPMAGGMLTYAIPGYRLPTEVVQKELDTILAHDIDMKYNQELGRDFTVEDLRNQGYRAVFIAVGTQKAMTMPVESDTKPKGIYDCLKFLRMANTGEQVELGEKVIVIGGGNVAVDTALTARRLGAKDVRMVCLEKCDEMPAHKWELDQIYEEEVLVDNSWGMDQIRIENGKVVALDVKRCVSVFDENKRFNPTYDACTLNSFPADTIIFAIGMGIDKSFAKGVENLELLPNGRIKTDPVTFETNVEGVFAGGDSVLGPSTIIQAIATGSQAAESIDRKLRGKDLYEDRGKITEREEYVKDLTGIKKKSRAAMRMLPVAEREGTFKEVALGYSEEEALAEASRCMSCAGCCECMLCVAECEAKAINHEMIAEEYIDLNVGAVIMAPGLDRYDPKVRGELGFGRWPNVVTALQFERILSASGPYQGTVTRPGDGKHPIKIAWIQCVGSRDTHNANPWCSSVCCMYATKQAVIAKEHDKIIEPTIFFMDMRAYGKDFDKYVERARDEYGVRYMRTMVSAVREEPGTGDLMLRYALEDGALVNEKFDMVVLSVGLEPHKDAAKLAEIAGIEMNNYLFPKTDTFAPVDSTRPGVFVTGIYQSPKDIPETVVQGSAVAGQTMALLGEARWTETIRKELPPERDVSEEEPRIAVFVCSCGINISGTVDVAKVVEAVKDLPNVAHAENTLYTCSQDSQEKIKQVIAEKGINRLLVASCTPRTHTQIFQETLEEAGLNKYLFELADIREQCSWCHMGQKEDATKKAIRLVRMMIGKVRLLQPVKVETVGVVPKCLVVGGGVAGMTAALSIAEQGFDVHIVEKEPELGGLARNVYYMPDGSDVQYFVRDRVSQVRTHPRITVHAGVEVHNTDGFVGNFKTELTDGTVIEHGTVVLATGGVEYQPTEYLYNESDRVITQRELEKKIFDGLQPAKNERYVMIQCVGSREEPNQYCSRICCQDAVKNAIEIKERNSAAQVFILYRDMRTYGLREDFYKKARDLGVIFIRYDVDKKPQIAQAGGKLSIRTWDYILDREITLDADWVVLSTGLRPHPSTEKVGGIYKVTRNIDGYFLEAHVKLRPVDFPSDGLFVAGLAHAPKNLDETISQALAAAGRAGVVLSHERLAISGLIAKQKRELCMSCLSCLRICPFGSPFIDEDGKISHNEIKCHGCGLCAGICPAKAFQVNGFRDDQMIAMIDAAVEQEDGGLIS